jgi:hypothetical protein
MRFALPFILQPHSTLRAGALAAASLTCIAHLATAQQHVPGTFRLGRVYIQVDATNGEPIGFLAKRHFELTAAGRNLPFTISNVTTSRKMGDVVPRTYLLVLPPPFPPEEMKEPCHTFARALKAGWRIRVVDGSRSQVETILCGTGKARRAIRVVRGPEMDALKNLGRTQGRRVVLYLTSETHTIQPELQKLANDAAAIVYDVGGHETYFVDEQAYPSYQAPTGPAAMHPGAFARQGAEPSFVAQPGVARPEVSIHSALTDATRGAQGFYLLTTSMPRASPVLSLRLKVRGGADVRAWADVEDDDAPRLEILR